MGHILGRFHCRPFSLLAPRKLQSPSEASTEAPYQARSWYFYTLPCSMVLVCDVCFAVYILFSAGCLRGWVEVRRLREASSEDKRAHMRTTDCSKPLGAMGRGWDAVSALPPFRSPLGRLGRMQPLGHFFQF